MKKITLKTPHDWRCLLLGTWFGSGLIPPIILRGMAGTYGSIAALPLCWMFVYFTKSDDGFFVILRAVAFLWFILFLGESVIDGTETLLGPQTDWKGKTRTRVQNQIVIDEVWGMLITCTPLIWINFHSWGWALGLALAYFRFFDIVKVWPIKHFDKQETTWGVMLDDGVAGVYAATCLAVTMLEFNL